MHIIDKISLTRPHQLSHLLDKSKNTKFKHKTTPTIIDYHAQIQN